MKTSPAGTRIEFTEIEVENVNQVEALVHDLIGEMVKLSSNAISGAVCEIDFGNGNAFEIGEMSLVHDFLYFMRNRTRCEIHSYEGQTS